MKNLTILKLRSSIIGLLCTLFSLSMFSQNKTGNKAPQVPVKLKYSLAAGQSVSYTSLTSVTQTMDINGQTMNNYINQALGFKMKSSGMRDKILNLEITIDSLIMKVETPNGSTGSRVKDLEGKTFKLVISPFGVPTDLSEAEKIEYNAEGQGTIALSQTFQHIFPVLHEGEVKPGDTWTGSDTLRTRTSISKIIQSVQSVNKFVGIEQVNGMDCAKITADVSGTIETTVQNMGMDVFYSGPYQGAVTLLFAIKEGYFIRQETTTKMNGTMKITGAQDMTFPIIVDTTSKIEAVK